MKLPRLFHKHDCATEGHVMRTERRQGWRNAPRYDRDELGVSHWRCNIHMSDQEREQCRHCPEATLWRETYGECFQSFSWPADMADKLRREGWVSR